jgi:hypothetical protein
MFAGDTFSDSLSRKQHLQAWVIAVQGKVKGDPWVAHGNSKLFFVMRQFIGAIMVTAGWLPDSKARWF